MADDLNIADKLEYFLRKALKYTGRYAGNESVLRMRLRRKIHRYRNHILVGAMLAGGLAAGVGSLVREKMPAAVTRQEAAQNNMQKIAKNQAAIMTAIAYVEGFSDKPYFCGAKQTIGYGSTVYPDGSRVKKTDKAISCRLPVKYYKGAEFKKGREYVKHHLENEVYPFIKNYVTRELSAEELLGTVLFVYNVGGESFSGHKKNGTSSGKASAFLQSLNSGEESAVDCAKKMTGFRAMNGKRANGLLKRHWVAMGLFTGKLEAADLLKLKAAGFYDIKDMSFFYKKSAGRNSGYWEPDFSPEKINKFLTLQTSAEENTAAILDQDVIAGLKNSAAFDLAVKWQNSQKQR